jgi:hypothetical protein
MPMPGWGMPPGMPFGMAPMTYGYNPMYGRGAPFRNFALENVNAGMPQFQMGGPLGALISSVLSQNLAGGMPGSWANRMMLGAGMQPGPMAGSGSRFMRGQQQIQDLYQMSQASSGQDAARMAPIIQRVVASMGYKAGDARRIASSLSGDLASTLNNPMAGPILEALGISEDMLAPGGLTQSFKSRMYLAGMGGKTGPGGGQQLGVKAIEEITKSLEGKFAGGGRAFTKGSTMKDFGEIAVNMSQRGLMQFGKSPDEYVKSLESMNDVVASMRDMMGAPDAPVNEIFQSLEDMFGGGLKTISAATMKQMINEADGVAQALNIAPDVMHKFMTGMAAVGKNKYGLADVVSGRMGLASAMQAAGAGMVSAGPLAAGQVDVGRLTDEQKQERISEAFMSSGTSQFGTRLASLITMQNESGGTLKGNPRIDELVKKARAGKLTDAETKELNDAMMGSKFFDIGAKAGYDTAALRNMLSSDELTQNIFGENGKLSQVALQARDVENRAIAAPAMARSTAVQDIERATGGRFKMGEFMDVYSARTGADSERESKAAIAKYLRDKGVAPDKIDAMAGNLFREIQDTYKRTTGATETQQTSLFGSAARAAALQKSYEAAGIAGVSESMRELGVGGGKGGLTDIVQRAMSALAMDPGMDLEQVFGRSLGGIDIEQQKKLKDRALEINKSIADKKSQLQKLHEKRAQSGASPELDAEIKKLSGEIAGTIAGTSDFRSMVEGMDKRSSELRSQEATKSPEPAVDEAGMPLASTGGGSTRATAYVTGPNGNREEVWHMQIEPVGGAAIA